jgi:hypothetical protein
MPSPFSKTAFAALRKKHGYEILFSSFSRNFCPAKPADSGAPQMTFLRARSIVLLHAPQPGGAPTP